MKNRNNRFHGAGGHSGLGARNFTFKKVVKQVMRDLPYHQFMVQIENKWRGIFQEELGRLHPYLSSTWSPMERSRSETPSSRPRYKLRFVNSPLLSTFAGSKIETEDGSPVGIELVDASTNIRAISGPLSSSRVEIVPLNADFTEESWNAEIFKRNILKQRKGKKPLLTGDLTITLQDGYGVIPGDVAFSDNSRWTRSGKFRLGAKLTGGGTVEARSEAFICKDQRGESCKKHHPPYPNDDVWRLKKIAKGGVSANRLGDHKIYTVKHFRRLYTIDPNTLYNIIGISKNKWDAIVSHAMRCVLEDSECYIYNTNAHDVSVSLLFNSVYELKKVSFSGGEYQNVDQLTTYQPILDKLKMEAYQKLDHFTRVDGRDFENHPQRSLQCPQNPGFGMACPGPGLQQFDFQGTLDPSSSSMSRCRTAAGSTVFDVSFAKLPNATFHVDKKFLDNVRNSFKLSDLDQVHGELQSVVSRGGIKNDKEEENAFDYHHHYDMSSPGTQQDIETMYLTVSGTEEGGMLNVHFENVNLGSPRARWCKVKAALKIREVWKHTTARKRGKTCKKLTL